MFLRNLFWLGVLGLALAACTEAPPATEPPAPTRISASPTAVLAEVILPTPTVRPSHTPAPSATNPPTTSPTETATQTPSPTWSPTATATIQHTDTPLPSSTPPPTETPKPAERIIPTPTRPLAGTGLTNSGPEQINGVPIAEIVVMPPEVRQRVREIYTRGQNLGRNSRAFSKIGDSVTLTDHYLTRFDSGGYNLGPYAYLQPAIDHYAGSFARYGVASRVGLHAWGIFDPLWANKELCEPNEDMIACEIRLHNPSVLLVRLGSNDSGPGSVFEENIRLLVEYAIDNGVIPVLATKADRFEGPDNRNNLIMQALAAEYQVPLWHYDRLAETLPRKGLSGDDVHMTMADADDYTLDVSYERGYPMNDLTALMMLHAILQEVS